MSALMGPSTEPETDAAAAQTRSIHRHQDSGAASADTSLRVKRLRRHLAHRWNPYTILMPMLSSGAYGIVSLDHPMD